ncbi:DUF485 domain-containing protein [uncultured Streptomyces sp.]|uniref:DUF485 domain-containing protein n=1 Tax=uncultured Streptomyces sp. TaxID=174707 RepID=UPI002629EF3C|nr:DUF485 domain-containing protein [uncultured Streptomyces sp.]
MPPEHPQPPPYAHDYLLPWQSSPPPAPARRPVTAVPPAGRHSDLRRLRRAYRLLRRVSSCTALGYFTLFLILSAYAPGLMTRPVGFAGLTVGLLWGVGQFPVALLSIAVYERTAHRTVDPLARVIRERGGPAPEADAPHRPRRGTDR